MTTLAPRRALERGRDYYERGLVRELAEYNGMIVAKVDGSRTYTVKIHHTAEHNIDYSCTCPMGDDGEFCKHCVAVALAWIDSGKSKNTRAPAVVNLKDIESYLHSLDKSLLVEMLMEQAQEDERLRKKLHLKTTSAASGGFNAAAWKRLIRDNFEVSGFVHYRQARTYAAGLWNLIESLEELLTGPHVSDLIGLAEYALKQATEAVNNMDDSDGYMGEVIDSLQKLHFDACQKTKADPEKLAARLFELELNSEWDIFCGAAKTYASILGPKGLAVYRRLADESWKKLAPSVSKNGLRRNDSHAALNLIEIKETLAEMSGSIAELVDIKKRDLTYAYNYLEIAEIYRKAGNRDKALEWAEAGMKAFPTKTDSRLREFLADEYQRRKRSEEALDLIWANFTDSPSLDRYQQLRKQADKMGQWPKWQEKAVSHIRAHVTKQDRKSDRRSWYPDYSLLVEIFLWEKNPEAAWREALEGGCSSPLWMKLAALREQNHPFDAVDVYKKFVEPTVDQTNNQAYDDAIKLIKKIQAIMKRLEKESIFSGYVTELRTKYKAKRNFIKLLDKIRQGTLATT